MLIKSVKPGILDDEVVIKLTCKDCKSYRPSKSLKNSGECIAKPVPENQLPRYVMALNARCVHGALFRPYLDPTNKPVNTLTFKDYDEFAETTDVGTSAQDNLKPGWMYYLLGLVGETGELAEKIQAYYDGFGVMPERLHKLVIALEVKAGLLAEQSKKIFRDNQGEITEDFKRLVMKEVGDILWYAARLSAFFGFSLAAAAALNIVKLTDRMKRDKLHGDGDER